MQPIPDYGQCVGDELDALARAGALQPDKAQSDVAARLDRVLKELKSQRAATKSSALGWLFAARRKPDPAIPGLYIHGSVGRGKTMLMDMFFKLAPIEKKRRAHFHEFMADVHARIHDHRQKLKRGETKQADPVPPVAAAIFAESRLLCFDEFTVTDIADAMILGRLFTELFSLGCTLVATSNVVPDNLYHEGLNRGLFLPFIAILKKHVAVVSLDSPTDYRLEKLDQRPVYLSPLDNAAELGLQAAWRALAAGRPEKPVEIQRPGRVIEVRRSVGRMAWFTFAQLCETPLGASDYLAIAERFDRLFVEGIPHLGPDRRNETKRFITLIDALYDKGVQLFASAVAEPEQLLTAKRGVEGFEFDRTVSRLFEMRSADYLDGKLPEVAER
ncbi:cell division protein ZapE [Rhizobium halophytocola]|uniref:Cell division protein ZapE n=1 Tax=Rhizobium halophytocola TaxID=735519 RepID=A0ABS4E2T1_9HYPH|nr:cell division protein ZapE [Rhizobium halophytocola]MBP1852252.1 cell division protein ZapE [Rhizobium halophytocola]